MTIHQFWRCASGVCFGLLLRLVPGVASAQITTVDDSIHAGKTLFTWRDPLLATGFAGLTVAMFPADHYFATKLQDSSTQANRFLKNGSKGIQFIADPGAIVIGVGMYGAGRLLRWNNVADLGLHGTEAVVITGITTAIIKGVAGRARPYISADTSPLDFRFWRGFDKGGYQSFPSGHSTVAFAAAAVVTSESQRWWPRGIWLVAPVMYGGATLVGISRMYNNAHWASDVAVGAAIGTFGGIKVVRYSHGHTNNFIDRTLLAVQVIPAADGGVGLGWSLLY